MNPAAIAAPGGVLAGKTALVTGAGRGLGQALCEALCAAGASVVVADLRADLADEVAQTLVGRGHEAVSAVVDVGNEAQVAYCVANAYARFGAIDILINNAGVDFTLPIDELEVAHWDRVINTNLRGPFLFCKAVVGEMKARASGHIVNIASRAADRAGSNASACQASQWALTGFSQALHVELRRHGIKVTAVIASGMRAPFPLDRLPEIDPPMLAPPGRVAEAIVHLLAMPPDSVIAEISILPTGQSAWP